MSTQPTTPGELRLSPEVARARRDGTPVLALESTIIAHGLPRPRNREVARELEAIAREEGACPATVAVLDGVAHVGLDDDELARVAEDTTLRKLGTRDLPVALALGASGATTVSATAWLAAAAGIRVFATGGLGGVHRGFAETFDESADLGVLSHTRLTVVSAGVQSILDVPATLERLESLSVTVVGFATAIFPGFYLHSSGRPLDWTVHTPAEVAGIMHQQDALHIGSALLVANPVPEAEQLDPELHDRALAEPLPITTRGHREAALAAAADQALAGAERDGGTGQRLTPYLLAALVQATGGAALEANLAAVRGNVRLGARIAVAFAR